TTDTSTATIHRTLGRRVQYLTARKRAIKAIAALVGSAPISTTSPEGDPCGVLGHLPLNNVTVLHVSACYKSIDFNQSVAKTTLDSLYTLYNDFFIFRDTALTPNLTLPFTSPPVDILAGLEHIRNNIYTTDYDFHTDLTLLARSLNDAHVSYYPDCYNSFLFEQPWLLYAPVVKGQQSLRVYKDELGGKYDDCEVLQINELDALPYLQAWGDKNTGFSKDAGVRLNNMLVSQEYSTETQTWGAVAGSFSRRVSLPESEYVGYRVRCNHTNTSNGLDTEDIRLSWLVRAGPDPETFTDKASFLQNICLATTEPGPEPKPELGTPEEDDSPRRKSSVFESELLTRNRREEHIREYTEKKERLFRKRAEGGPDRSIQDLPDATFVDGDITAVYQLKSNPKIGVLVVPTMDVSISTEVPAIQARLAMLADRGVTHIIIDTSGNGGGDIAFSSLLVNVFFPTTDKRTSSHLARFRDSPTAIELAGADLANNDVTTYFESGAHANKTTGKPFTSNLFSRPVTMDVNGRVAQYTDEFYMDYNLSVLDETKIYPWTGHASKIVILTDGQCGSACGMASELFVNRNGVKAVAVGGYTDKALSMFSFAGASVLGLQGIVDAFKSLGVPPTMASLPYKNVVNIGMIEVYSGKDTIPLEYNPKRYIAAHRLDYTRETARNHDLLWGAVAEIAWS
ncbi:hypothetical protein BGZ65_008565, partial [Modicella reniformis]